jgi:hypothetical protein
VDPACTDDGSGWTGRKWKQWATWSNLGLLLAAMVLPFGWLLPAAKLCRVRAAARRSRSL